MGLPCPGGGCVRCGGGLRAPRWAPSTDGHDINTSSPRPEGRSPLSRPRQQPPVCLSSSYPPQPPTLLRPPSLRSPAPGSNPPPPTASPEVLPSLLPPARPQRRFSPRTFLGGPGSPRPRPERCPPLIVVRIVLALLRSRRAAAARAPFLRLTRLTQRSCRPQPTGARRAVTRGAVPANRSGRRRGGEGGSGPGGGESRGGMMQWLETGPAPP